MEYQAWILRDILIHLERQEAAGEEDPNGITGEFAVSSFVFSDFQKIDDLMQFGFDMDQQKCQSFYSFDKIKKQTRK